MACTVVIDVMTEAISNAVRHSAAPHADLAIAVDAGGLVTITVSNDGHSVATAGTQAGLGTNLLDECTLDWSRATTPAGYVLTAVVPTIGTEPAIALAGNSPVDRGHVSR
jgi:signal transduction histidine kinase